MNDNRHEEAKFPKYSLMTKRLETFKSWKFNCQYTPEDMANGGFIYWGVNDEVQCYDCGIILHSWPEQVSILAAHLKLSTNCRYANLKKENPESLIQLWDNPAVMAIQDQLYSNEIIEKAFYDLNAKGIINPDAETLMSKVLELDDTRLKVGTDGEEEEKEKEEHNLYGYNGDKKTQKIKETISIPLTVVKSQDDKYDKVDLKKHYEHMEKIAKLKQENKILKEQTTCKLCSQPANTVFLPCGHVSVCINCTKKLPRCATCRTLIRGIVKIYLV
jgi:hypothetical protein